MLRVNAWIVAFVAVAIIPLIATRSRTEPVGPDNLLMAAPVAPTFARMLNGCTTVPQRLAFEESDCLQAVRASILAGETRRRALSSSRCANA